MDSLKRGCVCRVEGERKEKRESRAMKKESIHVRLTVKKRYTNFNEKKTVSSSSSSVVATTRKKKTELRKEKDQVGDKRTVSRVCPAKHWKVKKTAAANRIASTIRNMEKEDTTKS